MAFDVKAKIEELAQKLKDDPKLAEKFKSDPVKTVEGLLGIDLPDDQGPGQAGRLPRGRRAGRAEKALLGSAGQTSQLGAV